VKKIYERIDFGILWSTTDTNMYRNQPQCQIQPFSDIQYIIKIYIISNNNYFLPTVSHKYQTQNKKTTILLTLYNYFNKIEFIEKNVKMFKICNYCYYFASIP